MHSIVSIIIPNFNRAELIGQTLDSILAQTYGSWECLVIDDGSTDDSELIVKAYSNKDERIKFYKRPNDRPKGANSCRNYGYEISKGDYINWFDSDDLMDENKLQLQVDALKSTTYPFSVCNTMLFNGTLENKIGLLSNQISSDSIVEDFFCKKIVWFTQAPLFRKTFLKEHGFLFDETLHAGQEWELFMRVLFKNSNFHTINKPLVFLRDHQKRISASKTKDREWFYLLGRYKIYREYKEHFSEKMIKYIRFYFLKTLKDFLRSANYKRAFFVWRHCILQFGMLDLKNNLLVLLSFISFMLFKKGDIFLSKVI